MDTPTHCPICNRTLAKSTVVITCDVPDGAKQGREPPGVTVLGRGTMYRKGNAIVQDVKVWDGGYKSDWPPFCSIMCAARMGTEMWKSGVRPANTLALEAPKSDQSSPIAEWTALADKLVAENPDTGVTAQALIAHASMEYPLGHELHWPDKSLPPPEPGVFRYGKHGRKVATDPASLATQQDRAASARQSRLAKFQSAPPKPLTKPVIQDTRQVTYGASDVAKAHFKLSHKDWTALPRKEQDRLRHTIGQMRRKGELPLASLKELKT